jgi:fumarylacetoacetate (FAA) hydrolase
MKFATLLNGTPDGRLVLVSSDLQRALAVSDLAPTLQAALDDWADLAPLLEARSRALNDGSARDAVPFRADEAMAPLPRAWQWLDGSAFKVHLDLATRAFQLANVWGERPLMYQGMSHQFLAPAEDVPLPDEQDGIDFEGEFAVVTGKVPAGASVEQARASIRLVMQINDWSLRLIGRDEMNRGFGWVRAKPACSAAPVAVTPDELGPAWRDARVGLDLQIDWNGTRFGAANGREMSFGFDELIAHAAYSRELCAGTIVGSGTVANAAYGEVGSSCILERRGIEILEGGEARTPFLKFGDGVRMEAKDKDGRAPFGAIDQRVVKQS